MTDPMRVLSLGGGTQSCALALMSAAGDLPRLDHVIFADTHGELPETYAYLDYLRGRLDEARIPLHVVSAGRLEAALLLDHPINHNPTPPAHVLNPPTADNPTWTKGRIGAYRCSYDYKRRQIERKVKELCGGRGAWKKATVEQWIGMSYEETARMRQSDDCRCGHKRVGRAPKADFRQVHTTDGCTKCACTGFDRWQINRWPLVEMKMYRADTIAWFGAHGHPTPPRSACWFCPNSGNARWQALKSEHPDLFARAVTLDETIRNGGGFNERGNQPFRGKLFLHASCEPLADADLRTARQVVADSGQAELFDDNALALDCAAGVCFT